MLDEAGFLTQHMAAHVAAMNLAAPLCAAALLRTETVRLAQQRSRIATATALQIALLWIWHSPRVFSAAFDSEAVMLAMHVSLFLAGCWFWLGVITAAGRANWSALAAVLVTGKLFCLLGVLFILAPRAIYWQVALLPLCLGAAAPSWTPLEDQQLAGLLMLTACPAVYVTAAIVLARRWLATMNNDDGWSPGREVG